MVKNVARVPKWVGFILLCGMIAFMEGDAVHWASEDRESWKCRAQSHRVFQ